MTSPDRIICHEEDQDQRPYDTTPFHLTARGIWGSGEELKDPKQEEEAYGDHVDNVTGSS